METHDPSRSLEQIFSDVDYGRKRLAQLQLDQTDIQPVMVKAAEARLYGKGKLVDTTTHKPANPHHSKQDVADAIWIIKRICLLTHRRQPKWKADEKRWFAQFGPNGKFLLGLSLGFIIGAFLFFDADRDGIPDVIQACEQLCEQVCVK